MEELKTVNDQLCPVKFCFADQIQKIEVFRKTRFNKQRQSRLQSRQNLKSYVNKKLIIPLSYGSSSQIRISPKKMFGTKSRNTQNCIYDYSDDSKQKNHIKSVQRRTQIWKFGISPDQMNELCFGKQLRIGFESRKKFITDNDILKKKSVIIFRMRLKHKLCNKELENINKNKNTVSFHSQDTNINLIKKRGLKEQGKIFPINLKNMYKDEQIHTIYRKPSLSSNIAR